MKEVDFSKFPDLENVFQNSSNKSIQSLKYAWAKYFEYNYNSFKNMCEIGASLDKFGNEKSDMFTVTGKLFARFVDEILVWQKQQTK